MIHIAGFCPKRNRLPARGDAPWGRGACGAQTRVRLDVRGARACGGGRGVRASGGGGGCGRVAGEGMAGGPAQVAVKALRQKGDGDAVRGGRGDGGGREGPSR